VTFSGRSALLTVFVLVTVAYIWRWFTLERAAGGRPRPRWSDAGIGFATNFLDTLGIGCFAPTTALFKMLRRMPDEEIPGTLNVGHALPCMTEALVFVAIVTVDITTLASMIAAAVLGAWLGAPAVARAPRRLIQLGMGIALLASAALMLAKNLNWLPGGGQALGLHGVTLAFAVAVNCVLGALMMLGVGLYAPCLILVSLLGMSPLAAFPIMMGSCALLMPVGGLRFIRTRRYCADAALGLAVGGIPGVLCAAAIVWSLPIVWLRWLVVLVVVYAATLMLLSGVRASGAAGARKGAP
jgi:uncharacterized membrane protein YfcA